MIKLLVLPNFLEITGHNVAMEGDMAKAASSCPLHGILE